MEYTNQTLHGLVYQHKDGGSLYRVIQIYDKDKFSHTTCDLVTGITIGAWITLEEANRWIKEGTWILQPESKKIINNYEIY